MKESALVNPSTEEPRGGEAWSLRLAGPKAKGDWMQLSPSFSGVAPKFSNQMSPPASCGDEHEGAEVVEQPSSSHRKQGASSPCAPAALQKS